MTKGDYTDNHSTLDTPLKPTLTVQTAGLRTLAADVEKMVEKELKSHCVVADTDGFISHYFPVSSELIDKVYEKIVHDKHYNKQTKTWRSIPQQSAKESTFYSPLIDVCEAIRKAHTDEDSKHYNCRWFMSPNQATKSPDTTSSLIRPDVFLLLGMEGEAAEWEEQFNKLEGKDREARLIKYILAWWLRVSVIIEVKRKDDQDILSRVTQLMTYLRQVLREQLDRWFVPGFLLTGTQFAAWVVDRSGAFGMQKSFNFHEEPKKFIQIILACSILPPSRLGWDTSMRLWKRPEPLHSFSENIKIEDYAENAYARQWVFEMPVRNELNKLDGQRGLFLTTKALSVVRAECMQGRATVVWAAQRLKDGKVASDEIFILKQCWRPITAKPEGELYPPANEAEKYHIGCVYSHEDVEVDGFMIDTHKFIRGNLTHKLKDPSPLTNMKGNRKREAENFESAEEQESYLFVIPATDHHPLIFNFDKADITDRVLSRTLLFKSHGWALHRFSDRLELVRVCDHIVEALEFLYFQKGTIQRDISIGNVLISSITDRDGAKGCLIDFDYAKVVEKKKPTVIHQTENWFLSEGQQISLAGFDVRFGNKLPPRAAHALAFYDNAVSYLKDLKTITEKSSPSDEMTEEDIGFLSDENTQVPDLASHEPQETKRSATIPFASPEVLNVERIFVFHYPHPEEDPRNDMEKVENVSFTAPHDTRHDIEALFWCMTYICMTREGPGGKRRKELRPEFKVEDNKDVMDLRHINYCFFSSDQDNLAHNKAKLFKRGDYDQAIICHFHPYFEPLKPLMRQWWKILRFAHQYPMFETIHKTLRKTLQMTIKQLAEQPENPEDLEKTAEVIERRKKELEELRRPFHSQSGTDPEESASAPLDASPRNDRILHSHVGSDYQGSAISLSTSPSSESRARKKVKNSAAN